MTKGSNNGVAGVTISAAHDEAFGKANGSGQRVLAYKSNDTGATDVITITAPEGYVIKSFSISGFYNNAADTYTLQSADGTKTVAVSTGSGTPSTLTVDNINYKSTTFKIHHGDNSSWMNIADFKIELAKEYSVELHAINGESYATLYVPFDLIQTDNKTKAYYITEVTTDGTAILTETPDDGRKIAHNTAVVLINSEGATHTSFAVTSGLVQPVVESVNMLKGTLVPIKLDMGTYSYMYSLGVRKLEGEDDNQFVVGFYNSGRNGVDLGANRAYLNSPVSPPIAKRGFDFTQSDDENIPLPIVDCQEETSSEQDGTPWFTLDGRQLSGKPSTKGIYLKDGNKILIQ